MSRNWSKWGFSFWAAIARHVGTAGLTWLSLGIKDGKFKLNDLLLALLVGGVLPSVFTFLQSTPVPPDEEETKT